MLNGPDVFSSPESPKLVLSLFCHHDDYSGRHRLNRPDSDPLRTRPRPETSGISPLSASWRMAISAPRPGKLSGDRIGPEKNFIVALMVSVLLLIPDVVRPDPASWLFYVSLVPLIPLPLLPLSRRCWCTTQSSQWPGAF